MREHVQPKHPLYGSIPEAARRFGIGEKLLRRRVAEGEIPAYAGGTARLRVKFSEVEAWLRSTRVRPTSHAYTRVAEIERTEKEGRRS